MACGAVKSSADVLLLQETKILGTDLCKRAEDAAMRSGWQGTINAANNTDNGGASAGVGILAKKHIGMKYDSIEIQKKYRSRIAYAWLGLGRKGGVHVMSVYLWTSEGLTPRNQCFLAGVERITK